MDVTKASGKKEKFDSNKILRTCLRAGATQDLAINIIRKVESKIYNGISTKRILRLVLKILSQKQLSISLRYNLKQAMLDLGPSGFIFEKFITRLFQEYGWDAWRPPILKGFCIDHEVDVIAKRQSETRMIECKYHNMPGIRSREKDVLYVWSRFLDLKDNGHKFDIAQLICNTKFSDEVIKYARCKGMKLLGWRYPVHQGLEELIGEKHFYPITILGSLNRSLRDKLFANNIILCKDIIKEKKEILQEKVMIKNRILVKLINEANIILKKIK